MFQDCSTFSTSLCNIYPLSRNLLCRFRGLLHINPLIYNYFLLVIYNMYMIPDLNIRFPIKLIIYLFIYLTLKINYRKKINYIYDEKKKKRINDHCSSRIRNFSSNLKLSNSCVINGVIKSFKTPVFEIWYVIFHFCQQYL